MISLVRSVRSEFCKMKRSGLLLLHMGLPAVGALVFLAYYRVSPWDHVQKLTCYYDVVAAAFPVMISIVVGKNVSREEEARFQRILSVRGRASVIWGKWAALFLPGALAAFVAVVVFQTGGLLSGSLVQSLRLGVLVWLCLLAANVILYLIHIFLSLRFGRTASILTAGAGSIVGMLTLTGLGEGIWYGIPYSMASRIMEYLIYLENGGLDASARSLMTQELDRGACGILIWAAVLGILVTVWFQSWEGHDCYE